MDLGSALRIPVLINGFWIWIAMFTLRFLSSNKYVWCSFLHSLSVAISYITVWENIGCLKPCMWLSIVYFYQEWEKSVMDTSFAGLSYILRRNFVFVTVRCLCFSFCFLFLFLFWFFFLCKSVWLFSFFWIIHKTLVSHQYSTFNFICSYYLKTTQVVLRFSVL